MKKKYEGMRLRKRGVKGEREREREKERERERERERESQEWISKRPKEVCNNLFIEV